MNAKNISIALKQMAGEIATAQRAFEERDLATCSEALQYVELAAERTYLAFIEYRDQYERGGGDI